MTTLSKLTNTLILLFLFLLPWQTRWIYSLATLNGRPWEYGTLSFYGTEILLWLIVILTGARLFGNKDFWKRIASRSNFAERWPALVIGVAIAFFAAYFYAVSPVKEISSQFASRFIGSICLMICLMASNSNFKQMGLAFWGGGVAQGILAISQFLFQHISANKWLGISAQKAYEPGTAVVQAGAERWLRAYGSFGWPNSLGVYLAVALIVGAIIFSQSKKSYWPYILAGQMVIFIGLIFSFSRGSWLAVVAGLLVYFAVVYKQKNNFALLTLAKQIFAFILITAVLMPPYFSLFATRLGSVGNLESISLSERVAQYNVAETIIRENLLTGVGPGLYTYYLAAVYPAPAYGLYQPVHNIYLLAVSELGVLMFMCLCVYVIWLIRQIWNKNPMYLSVIIVLLISGLFDHFLWSLFAGQALFWVVFGLGLAKKGPPPLLK